MTQEIMGRNYLPQEDRVRGLNEAESAIQRSWERELNTMGGTAKCRPRGCSELFLRMATGSLAGTELRRV